MLSLCNGSVDTKHFYELWEEVAKSKQCGAISIFSGIVRKENNIEALSFDIYEPLLCKWFDRWQGKAKDIGAEIFMVHSIGDVAVGSSSFMCAIISKNRNAAIQIYANFIEDFKHNAPIWKYDVINGKRYYAMERSHTLKGAGILK